MHFTLWPGARSNVGAHTEITWADFLTFVSNPATANTKDSLEGWSPAKFQGNRRGAAYVEAVSCIVLDDDSSGFTTEEIAAVWAGVAGAVHTSFRHTPEAPKHRVVLQCSRDLTADEQPRVWRWCARLANERGQALDSAPKDGARLWYVPARREGAPYAWAELMGAPLDVDAILNAEGAASNNAKEDNTMALTGPKTPTAPAERNTDSGGTRRQALALALGAAWPAKGRHEAQLALAGALRGEGFTEAEAVDFLTAVAGDRPKREATCRHTWGRPADAPLTGWTRLKRFVDPVLVDAARAALGRDAGWTEATTRRLAEAAARVVPSAPAPAPAPDGATTIPAGPFVFRSGGLDAEQPPLVFQIEGLICKADVVMLVAHGGSLKTWLAFSLAHAVASGRPWLGKYMAMRGRAGILDFESGDFEVVRRLKLLGVKDGDVADRLLRCSYSGANLTDPETWIALGALQLDLLVVDSFNAAAPSTDENDARAAVMLQHAGRFANETGCTGVFIHHARKGAGGDQRELVRGSTALFAACDRVFKFDEPEKKDMGIVLSTMRSIKDGAGRSPAAVRVELSDQGLKWIEAQAEDDEKGAGAATADRNRELVIAVLRQNTAGVPQKDLINVMGGKREAKFELLSQMALTGIVVEFSQTLGGTKKAFVMLKPGVQL